MLTKFREYFVKIITPLAKIFVKLGFPPNTLTLIGLIFSILYFILMYVNLKPYALLSIVFVGFFDAIDGMVARLTNKVSKTGAFLDSTVDRICDGLLISGLLFLNFNILLILFLLILSFLVSYVRARGEALGLKVEGIGIIERAERIILVGLVVLASMFNIIVSYVLLFIFIALTLITFIERIIFIVKNIS